MIFLTQILANSSYHLPFFNASSEDFYTLVEQIIREHDIPDAFKERVKHKEGGLFSSKREYLRINYGDLNFDICAAPFGKDFYVSWWLFESEDIFRKFLKGTIVGDYLVARAQRVTFYQADNEAVFKGFMQNAILEAIDTISSTNGYRLPDYSQPIK